MTFITTDFSPLTKHVQLALKHPSSRLFDDQRLYGSISTPLSKVDCSLAESGAQTLATALDALSEGRKHIASLCQSLSELENQVETALARCRALVAPIRRLPIEILQLIFRFVDQIGPNDQANVSPPVVAQICTLWREITIATPSLWTSIYTSLGPRNLQSRIERLTLWLERSASHPISLVIGDDSRPSFTGHEAKTRDVWRHAGIAVARAVKAHGSALDSLVLDINFHRAQSGAAAFGLLQTWIECDTFSMLGLKTLKLSAVWATHHEPWNTVKEIFRRKAPNLEHVDVNNAEACSLFALPCDNIKIFRGQPNAGTFAHLTTSAPSLEVLELWYLEDVDFLSEPVGPASSPLLHLSSLHLVSSYFTDLMQFLPPLPALRHLALSHDGQDGDVIDFSPVFQAWGSQLTFLSLAIDFDVTTATYIQECLALTPNLESLRIASVDTHQVQSASLPRLLYCEFHYDTPPVPFLRSLTEFSANAKTQFPLLRNLDISLTDSETRPRSSSGFGGEESLDTSSLVLAATSVLSIAGVAVAVQEVPWSPNKRSFDGRYFEGKGGIFDRLNPPHNPESLC